MATEAVLMADQKSKLMRREEVAEGTIAFHFEKPSGFGLCQLPTSRAKRSAS